MNWQAIGAIGEGVGAVAVVITLAFLIFQIRQNTTALRQQAARESTASLQQAAITMMYPAVAGTISKVYAEREPDLTTSEMAQVEQWCMANLRVYQQDFLDVRSGLQPASLWESRLPAIASVFASHWVRTWWGTIGQSYFTPQFQQLIQRMLSEEPPDQVDYWKRVSHS